MQQKRSFSVTSFTIDPKAKRILKRTAKAHNVAMSGLVSLAIVKLLEDRTPRQIEMLLKREGVQRRREA